MVKQQQAIITPPKSPMTAAAFDAWVPTLPHNDQRYEYISGEIYNGVSNQIASHIAAVFVIVIGMHIRQQKIGGFVTGADGGYAIGDERYIPDVAYIAGPQTPTGEAYSRNLPALVVEVISNPNSTAEQEALRIKTSNYTAQRIMVWIVNPTTQTVEQHQIGQPVIRYRAEDTLDGGDILPGFRMPLREIFPQGDE